MTVQSDPAGIGEKEIKTDWPVEEGLIAGTTKQKTESPFLEAEEGSIVSRRDKVGF